MAAATRLAVAKGLAIVGFSSILINAAIGVFWPLGAHTSGLIVGPIGVFTLIAAFFFSLKRKTVLVPALLIAGGLVSALEGVIETRNLAIIIIPGQILEFIFGVVILAMGVAKSLTTGRTTTSRAAAAAGRKTPEGGQD
jgi:hypothetical protein